VISVGAPKAAGLAAAIEDYESRIPHYFKFDSMILRPQRIKPGSDRNTIVTKESEALLARVPEGSEIVAVDERGATWSSEELARYLESLSVSGRRDVAFLIGGTLGLTDSLRKRSHHVLSLSSFTLPHEMARLVLAEQLYRAGTILRGEPYHKAG
jgi:23S rRNA (pseudouridine1915-N3)-methyltransferase